MSDFSKMTIAELAQSGACPLEVEFKPGVEDLEGYPEGGMRAEVLRVVPDGNEVFRVSVSYEQFEAFNHTLETANFYDNEGRPRLTASQAGYYRQLEDLYVMADDLCSTFFTPLDKARLALLDEFSESGSEESYVQWLEGQLVRARKETA